MQMFFYISTLFLALYIYIIHILRFHEVERHHQLSGTSRYGGGCSERPVFQYGGVESFRNLAQAVVQMIVLV